MSSKWSTFLELLTITKMNKSRSKLARLRISNKKTEEPETNRRITLLTRASSKTYFWTVWTRIKKTLFARLLRGKLTLKPRSMAKALESKY